MNDETSRKMNPFFRLGIAIILYQRRKAKGDSSRAITFLTQEGRLLFQRV